MAGKMWRSLLGMWTAEEAASQGGLRASKVHNLYLKKILRVRKSVHASYYWEHGKTVLNNPKRVFQ